MGNLQKHAAPDIAAAFLCQLERALDHLAHGETGSMVGVELLDDVVSRRADGSICLEQDKMTMASKNPITDRSEALATTDKDILLSQLEVSV